MPNLLDLCKNKHHIRKHERTEEHIFEHAALYSFCIAHSNVFLHFKNLTYLMYLVVKL